MADLTAIVHRAWEGEVTTVSCASDDKICPPAGPTLSPLEQISGLVIGKPFAAKMNLVAACPRAAVRRLTSAGRVVQSSFQGLAALAVLRARLTNRPAG